MKRSIRALRLALFPLLFVLGASALVAGYFEWKRFFGDLYLEEMQAIEAAVAQGAEVEYRRAGEPKYRVASRASDWTGHTVDPAWERERTTVPENAPFLGRVESVRFRDQSYNAIRTSVTRDVRDGLLRLPGLKSFEGRCEDPVVADPDSSSSDAGDDLEQALGRPLPRLPEPTLSLEEAEAPIPRGVALDATARAELAATIAAAWKRKRPLKAYAARSEHRPHNYDDVTLRATEVAEADRFASRIVRDASFDERAAQFAWGGAISELEPLLLLNRERAYVVEEVEGEWRRIATFDRRGGEAFHQERFVPRLPTPEALPRLNVDGERFAAGRSLVAKKEDPLGDNGSNIAAIERLDDRRLRLDLATKSTEEVHGTTYVERTEMIVREDFDFAVERFDTITDTPTDDGGAGTTFVVSVTRRLAKAGESIYAQETLRSRYVTLASNPAESRRKSANAERTLTAIVPLDEVQAAVFDPITYDRRPWPEPRTLPIVRSYRVLCTLGAGLIATSALGPLALRLRGRRRYPTGNESREPEAAAPSRLPRLRFGLAALLAAALAVISAAGAIKQTRDVVLADVGLLRRIDGGVEIERHEPSFPWSLVSTPAFPIDAPLKRIAISETPGQATSPVSEEVVKELVADPRLDSYHDLSARADVPKQEYVLADAAAALECSLPELPERIALPETALWLGKMPQGEELEADERAVFVERLANAWKKAAAEFPHTYLLVESHDYGESPEARATLRAGERCWSMGGVDSCYVSSQDETFRYRFGASDDGFSLVERTRPGTTALERPRDVATYGRYARAMTAGSPLRIDQPGRASPPPFAFPRYLYDEIDDFDAVALAALDPARIFRVSRLDEYRCRVDFDAIEVDLKEKAPDEESGSLYLEDFRGLGRAQSSTDEAPTSCKVATLAVIVREDLDCAVERTYCKAYVFRGLDGSPPRRTPREFYFTNRLVRTPEGIVLPEHTRVGDDRGGNRTWWDSRFAYDFAPAVDERIFSSPSLAHPNPYPVVERPWPVTWPLATGALSLLILAGLGARRIASAFTPPRASARAASRDGASNPE